MESMAINMRLMRSSMLEELSKDYVRTLKAKGLLERGSSGSTPSATRSCR